MVAKVDAKTTLIKKIVELKTFKAIIVDKSQPLTTKTILKKMNIIALTILFAIIII